MYVTGDLNQTYQRNVYPYMRIYSVEKREILEWIEPGYRRNRVLKHHEYEIGELMTTYLYQPIDRIASELAEVSDYFLYEAKYPISEAAWAMWGDHLGVIGQKHPFFLLGEQLFSKIYQQYQQNIDVDFNCFYHLAEQYKDLQNTLRKKASGYLNAESMKNTALENFIDQSLDDDVSFSQLTMKPEIVPKEYLYNFFGSVPIPWDFRHHSAWKNRNYVLTQVFYPETPIEIGDYFFYLFLQKDVKFKVCKNCSRYFAVVGKSKREYCRRIVKDSLTLRTCMDVGASRLYNSTRSQHPAMKAYMKVYKTRNSRMRANHMTKEEFTLWSAEARKERDNCVAGRITLEQFQKWLDSH